MTDSEKLDLLLKQIGAMDDRFTQLDNRIMKLENGVTDISLTLENEIGPNIRRVAEGHMDLSRKLDEALKVENEKEMLIIRVNTLENEMRRMKDKINSFA